MDFEEKLKLAVTLAAGVAAGRSIGLQMADKAQMSKDIQVAFNAIDEAEDALRSANGDDGGPMPFTF